MAAARYWSGGHYFCTLCAIPNSRAIPHMNPNYLDFEQPIAELEVKIEELQHVGSDNEINISSEIETLREKSTKLTEKIYSNLSAWDIVKVARHPLRPYTMDYIPRVFTDFDELHGDRHFADDNAIVGG